MNRTPSLLKGPESECKNLIKSLPDFVILVQFFNLEMFPGLGVQGHRVNWKEILLALSCIKTHIMTGLTWLSLAGRKRMKGRSRRRRKWKSIVEKDKEK